MLIYWKHWKLLKIGEKIWLSFWKLFRVSSIINCGNTRARCTYIWYNWNTKFSWKWWYDEYIQCVLPLLLLVHRASSWFRNFVSRKHLPVYAIVPFGGVNALNQDGKHDPIDSSLVTYIASYYWCHDAEISIGMQMQESNICPVAAGVILLDIAGNDFQILPTGKPNIYAAINILYK